MSLVPLLLYFPFVFRKERSLAIATGSGPSLLRERCEFSFGTGKTGMADAIL